MTNNLFMDLLRHVERDHYSPPEIDEELFSKSIRMHERNKNMNIMFVDSPLECIDIRYRFASETRLIKPNYFSTLPTADTSDVDYIWDNYPELKNKSKLFYMRELNENYSSIDVRISTESQSYLNDTRINIENIYEQILHKVSLDSQQYINEEYQEKYHRFLRRLDEEYFKKQTLEYHEEYAKRELKNYYTCTSMIEKVGWFNDFDKRIKIKYMLSLLNNKELDSKYVLYSYGNVIYTSVPGVFIISRNPVKFLTDKEKRMHCIDGTAIEWPNGYGQYYIHGVNFDKRDFEETILNVPSLNRLLSIDNAEVRSLIIMHHGDEYIINNLDIVDIYKTKSSVTGNNCICVLGEFKWDTKMYLVLEDHTTHKKTLITVPPEIETVIDAISWSFGLHQNEYSPNVET